MIEEVLYKALQGSDTFAGILAKHDGKPAVFYSSAANGADANWGAEQYPRCNYMIEWLNDAERKRAGVLTIDVFCINEAPEDIGESLVSEFSGAFMAKNEQTYSIIWSRTDPFEVEGSEPRVVGVSVYFDIIAFPIQETTTPDPVLSTMAWIKNGWPDVHVVGVDESVEFWKPTDENPVCYVRMSGETSNVKPTYVCSWLNANVVIHIICPSVKARMEWIKRFTNVLALEAEIITDDGSPMFIKSTTVDNGANPITAGQLIFVGEYGVLRKVVEDTEPMRSINIGGVLNG